MRVFVRIRIEAQIQTYLCQQLTGNGHHLFDFVRYLSSACFRSHVVSREKRFCVFNPTVCGLRRIRCRKRQIIRSRAYCQIIAVLGETCQGPSKRYTESVRERVRIVRDIRFREYASREACILSACEVHRGQVQVVTEQGSRGVTGRDRARWEVDAS